MNYRWNYGNGQVGPTRDSKRAARQDGAPDFVGYLEFYAAGSADDPGDWFRCGTE